jgi:hypothetical protein
VEAAPEREKEMKEPLSNMGLAHPNCLPPAPSPEALASIDAGTYVKIIRGGERFWCRVISQQGDGEFIGKVSNNLVRTDIHGLSNGELLTFPKEMTPEYLKLSWLTGLFAMRADIYLNERYFQTKVRNHIWTLTQGLLDAWKQEAKRKGIPSAVVEPTPEDIAWVDNPAFIKFGLAAQAARDKVVRKSVQ